VNLFYRIAYRIGFTPGEAAASHPPAARHRTALLDRETREHGTPPGAALDLGCGSGFWTIELTRRGWQTTGIDSVPKALARARDRARAAGLDPHFMLGDATALDLALAGESFNFILDGGTLHGLSPPQFAAAARGVTAAAHPGATLLMLAWAPGRRGPLPRGLEREEIARALPGWNIIDEEPFDATGLPPPLRRVAPRIFRLRRH
jgi:SAM-dependent methyltransferase